ncbi:6-phosphogluconolactonase [Anoplophora glabripennis]|uniref:6-phosphogluconolactonase n=1 Tax=Anoplophora glabripennis TaxID=217634 RepID=UPI0008741E4D|nr:6-phosphogluconolactonase [Anoplophora glabripennis]
MSVIVVENKDEVITRLCKLIETTAVHSIEENGTFNIGVSGGSLAPFLTTGLPNIKTDFSNWRIFFCDERLVPVDSPDSTFGLYKSKLIDSKVVPLKEEQFITIKQGVQAEEAAVDYAQKMQKYFPNSILPRFDMLLLGMGPDGHTCSLFPGHSLLNETSKWVAFLTDSPKPPPSRITLTFPVINNAKMCVFAISGKEKADMVKRILVDKEDLPSARVKPTSGDLYWILDREAGVHVNTKL